MPIKLTNQQLKTEIQQSQFIKQSVCENLDDSGEGSAPPVGEGQRHDGHRHDDAIGVAESESESQHGHHFDSLGSDELCKTRRLLLLALLGTRIEVSVVGGNAEAAGKGVDRGS